MPTHQETKILPYSAEQMYSLVADVAAYPEFLPWCSAARLRSTVLEGSSEILEADLVISFKVFRERFGSRVTFCLLYTSPSPRDVEESRMPSST